MIIVLLVSQPPPFAAAAFVSDNCSDEDFYPKTFVGDKVGVRRNM
jgi:hypothetical protein